MGLQVDLNGQVAIVTGASQGLGKAVAVALASNGATVACLARNAEKLAATVSEIEAAGGKGIAVPCDVTDRQALDGAIKQVAADQGRLDILVNNAGITRDKLARGMSDEDWDAVLATNLTSSFVACRAAAGIMRKKKSGRIINMASISGIIGNPGQANYSASKAGMMGMTRTMSKELVSRGITVNAVAPGFIASEMTEAIPVAIRDEVVKAIPAKRMGDPADVAAAVLFLASADAGYISGQTIVVDGGMTG
ncbi:3-oxoacyl-[acyl-carrier-protein] reductase FabG [Stieleria bergensis]|uniref:3-oxoacyl-[acyl-carrier-protein] reductase n=1 Tax=Stieleria bergensis TaxID=2528025 RepID=A0A517T0T7_9BACT|nr:3-oxoacyl-[acyl-carrier-protein] reductase FabG [Planctomycetes bacterium SV_7m_r]